MDAQVYPAGFLVAAGVGWSGLRWGAGLHGGYNWTNRRDWGVHQSEKGGGPGAGLTVERGLGTVETGWFVAARLDVWFLDVDWSDGEGATAGTTAVTVVQPTLWIGRGWRLDGARLRAGLGLGRELNTRLRGEPVGEGAIGLLGVSVAPG